MRRAALGRDWTKGSIIRNLWLLGWPMIISNSLNMIGPTIDMVWVGRLGAASIAGVGVAGMAVQLVDSMKMGLTVGVRAMIARLVGAGNEEEASYIARQGFVISAAFATLLALIGIFLSETILKLFGVEAEVVAQGAAYMRIMFVGSIFMSFRLMAEAIMQASGDAMTPMRIAFFFRGFHVALAPFLIFGWWFFPRLGVSGAALTNVLAQSLGMMLGLWFLLTRRSRLPLTFRGFRLDPRIIGRIVTIGVPASVMAIERTLAQSVLMWIIVPFGTLAVAAYSVNQRIEMLIFMPGMALGLATGVLAGQNLGARQPERAERSGWVGVGLAQAFMLACSLAIFLAAENFIRIFSNDPRLVELASALLRIAAAGYSILGFAVILQNCISGVGDTLPPMLVTLLGLWVVELPLAFYLSRYTSLGIYGAYWAIVAGITMRVIAYIIYFKLGRWQRKKV